MDRIGVMNPSMLEALALRGNFSVAEDDTEHLLRCWKHQSCGRCLNSDRCSWCPYTWSCVPNDYKIPLLAPAYEANLCPAPEERWELRTNPFGCGVSTTTSLTAITAIASTTAAVLVTGIWIFAIRWWFRTYRGRSNTRGNGNGWSFRWPAALTRQGRQDRERERLLPQQTVDPLHDD